MTTAHSPAVFYIFRPATQAGGPGEFLGTAATMGEAVALSGGSPVTIRKGPHADTSTRDGNARLTFRPWRLTMGTREPVQDLKPWALFIGGTAVNAYASQAEALGVCLARWRCAPPAMVDEAGNLHP